jgi:DNA-binding SARP family transcriptional activator
MMQLSNPLNNNKPGNSGGNHLWQDTVNLLKLMQVDYQGARRQLEQMNLHIAEREALVNQRIQYAILSSMGYHSLRLANSTSDSPVCLMGNAVLGEITGPEKVPESDQIEVRCFGRFEVRSASGQIEHWNSIKAKSVLQFLLMRPSEPTLKDTLLEAFWPEDTGQAAGNNLKAAVHSLRLSLNELSADQSNRQMVLFSEGSYRINPEISLLIDVVEFGRLRDKGRLLEKEHRIYEAIKEYEKAECLYRGDYLEDEPYEDWTILRRETLKDNYLFILNKLASHSLQTSDFENCIHYSQKILAKDPSREDAYRNLIRCYLKLSQRNQALRWYNMCWKAIKAELDTTPEKETIDLGESILNHRVERE